MAIKSATQTEASVAAITVADLLSALDLPDEIGAALYTGSQQQLVSITRWLAMQHGKDTLCSVKQPTPSALVKECKRMSSVWWSYLTDHLGVADDLKKVIFHNFRDAFEHTTHKMLTGHDLPKTKDGFQHNALRGLRKAAGHGDAALLLYRIRYWWPKATAVQCGKKWIAKTHKQWADELGISPRTYRTAQDRLLERGLIETITAEFNGHSMLHLRPTPEAIALFQYKDAEEV